MDSVVLVVISNHVSNWTHTTTTLVNEIPDVLRSFMGTHLTCFVPNMRRDDVEQRFRSNNDHDPAEHDIRASMAEYDAACNFVRDIRRRTMQQGVIYSACRILRLAVTDDAGIDNVQLNESLLVVIQNRTGSSPLM